jgi:hypothetical protein
MTLESAIKLRCAKLNGAVLFADVRLTMRGSSQNATLLPRLNETLAAQFFQPYSHDAAAVQIEQYLDAG